MRVPWLAVDASTTELESRPTETFGRNVSRSAAPHEAARVTSACRNGRCWRAEPNHVGKSARRFSRYRPHSVALGPSFGQNETMERTDFTTFRRCVIAGIEADLARETQQAEALRGSVVPVVVERIEQARRAGRCARVWLFGSFAWGEPRERSDVDLLVEGCADPDALAADVWRHVERAVHVVALERAPASLVERVLESGKAL
jgi:predicted nucleotidyltransferase